MFKCDQCGDLEFALYHGYNFGDRLLESIMFEVRHTGTQFKLTTPNKAKDYMKGLNEKHWLKHGAAAVEDEDTLTCPKCGGDIDGPALLG